MSDAPHNWATYVCVNTGMPLLIWYLKLLAVSPKIPSFIVSTCLTSSLACIWNEVYFCMAPV